MNENGHSHTGETQRASALVLLSGGLDSTVCLYLAGTQFGWKHISALSVEYGQRHRVELDHAAKICSKVGVEHKVIRHDAIPTTMLTDESVKVPNVSYSDIEGVSPMYVPFRNGQLLAILAGHAQARNFTHVFFGAHAEDAANWAYPDCTPEFIGAMANAIYVGTYHQVRLHTPLMWLMKSQIVSLGAQLNVPFDYTWSCYKGESHHCGTCATCISRREAFGIANVKDPTVYANDI